MAAHAFTVEVREGHVWVWQRGELVSDAEVDAVQGAVEAALEQTGGRRVVFDNRETEAPADRLRQRMFSWATGPTFERVALLITGDLATVRANMESLVAGRRLRAFADEASAVAWLLA